MIFQLLLLSQSAMAGTRWLYTDGFDDGGSAANFMGGFVATECWASIYKPESTDYPFTVNTVRVLVGGSNESQLFTAFFYNPSNMSIDGGGVIAGEGVSITGSNSSWNEITVSELKQGTVEIDSGYIAVSICHEEHDGYPSIAADTDGMSDSTANWLYTDSWYPAQAFGLDGDWIMRVCIESDGISVDECSDSGGNNNNDDNNNNNNNNDTGSDVVGDFVLSAITPAYAVEGEAVDVVLVGNGFAAGAEARIGGLPLVGQDLPNEETILGRTPTIIPVGIHDVEVVLDDGSSELLVGGFEVTSGGGCGCAQVQSKGSGWLLLLAPLLVFWRRR
jgi:hypothetical protein